MNVYFLHVYGTVDILKLSCQYTQFRFVLCSVSIFFRQLTKLIETRKGPQLSPPPREGTSVYGLKLQYLIQLPIAWLSLSFGLGRYCSFYPHQMIPAIISSMLYGDT